MSNLVLNTLNCIGRVVQNNSSIFLSTAQKSLILSQTRGTKHWLPKWKKLRGQKVIKVKLPNFDEDEDDVTPEKIRSKLKEHGLQPANPWTEKQIFLGCTGELFEQYVPPEGDGKFSIISKAGVQQKTDFMKKKGASYMAIRKIKKFEDDFSIGQFEETAQEIYLKAHEAIANVDKEGLRLYVTEKAYPQALHNVFDKSIRWRYVETLELPRVVHARCTHVITKENVFAQVTVRFHNQQTLAVYDRFGRVMHGSEIVKKDVLEYVVFEKHLANQYGIWRIHGKIIPDWMPAREYAQRTFLEKKEEKQPEAETQKTVSTAVTEPTPSDSTAPPIIAAIKNPQPSAP